MDAIERREGKVGETTVIKKEISLREGSRYWCDDYNDNDNENVNGIGAVVRFILVIIRLCYGLRGTDV